MFHRVKVKCVEFINSPEAQAVIGMMGFRYRAAIEDNLVSLVSIGITLFIAVAILGALTPTLTSLTTNTSFADVANSITSNLGSAFNVAAIIPLVVVAALIIAVIGAIKAR